MALSVLDKYLWNDHIVESPQQPKRVSRASAAGPQGRVLISMIWASECSQYPSNALPILKKGSREKG